MAAAAVVVDGLGSGVVWEMPKQAGWAAVVTRLVEVETVKVFAVRVALAMVGSVEEAVAAEGMEEEHTWYHIACCCHRSASAEHCQSAAS